MAGVALPITEAPAQWAKVVDHTRCIGCHACSVACKSENQVPLGVHRTYVKYAEVGRFPATRRAFQVTRCNQCDRPPCVAVCPTAAMFRRPDGIVDFDKSACVGCKACLAACPYDAVFINPDDGAAEKCNLCAHRIEIGLEPACVVACPTQAILVGDLGDASSHVATLVGRGGAVVRRPEKDTRPRLFYVGAHDATLDPLAARRPEGGLFMWSEQGPGADAASAPSAAILASDVLLAYDIPRQVPWDWRVSLSTWTKSLAAGVYLVPLLMVQFGWLQPGSGLWQWVAPIGALAFVLLTLAILIADLERPARAYLLVTRPQRGSWLVRGAAILGGYALVLALHLLGSLTAHAGVQQALMGPGLILAVMTAVYTAYLMAQARARDLWQSPLLPVQFAVQGLLAGSAGLAVVSTWLDPETSRQLAGVAAGCCLAHLLTVLAGGTVSYPTAHARLAARAMSHGRYAWLFWAGVLLVAAGVLTPWLGAAVAVPALAGLYAHTHAHQQAGQSVPLA